MKTGQNDKSRLGQHRLGAGETRQVTPVLLILTNTNLFRDNHLSQVLRPGNLAIGEWLQRFCDPSVRVLRISFNRPLPPSGVPAKLKEPEKWEANKGKR